MSAIIFNKCVSCVYINDIHTVVVQVHSQKECSMIQIITNDPIQFVKMHVL